MRRKNVSFHQQQEIAEPTINLTPLIDVVFVVLIIFIVIAPLLQTERIQLADGGSNTENQPISSSETSQLILQVKEDNTIWLNSHLIGASDLIGHLQQIKRQNPRAVPQLFHDKKACFGTYQIIKNALEAAGFEELDVLLQPQSTNK